MCNIDIVLGNYGENSPLKVSEQTPVELFALDIDGNESIDPIITHYINGISYPHSYCAMI